MAGGEGLDGVGVRAGDVDFFVDGGLADEGWVGGEEGEGDGGAEVHS